MRFALALTSAFVVLEGSQASNLRNGGKRELSSSSFEQVVKALDFMVGDCVTTYPPGKETQVKCTAPLQTATFIAIGRDSSAQPNYLYVCNQLLGGDEHCNMNWYTTYTNEREWVRDALDTSNPDVDRSNYDGVINALNFWFEDSCESNNQSNIDVIKTTCTQGTQTVTFRSTGIKQPVPNYIESCQNLLGGSGQDCSISYYSAGEDPKSFVTQAVRN